MLLLGTIVAATVLLGPVNAGAQHVSAYTVKPTVTKEMGDVGGTYFGKAPDPAKTRHYYICLLYTSDAADE